MKLAVAYLGNDRETPIEDFARIKHIGFDVVVLPVSEEHIAFQSQRVRELVKIAHFFDLDAWLSPWGLLGVFGGEGITAYKDECPYSCASDRVMESFINLAVTSKVDGIHWDEPRNKCCNVDNFLDMWMYVGKENNLDAHVYINSQLWVPESYTYRETMAGSASTWTDVYNEEKDLERFSDNVGVGGVWVRGFRVGADEVDTHISRLKFCLQSGIDFVGIWAYNGGAQYSILESHPSYWLRVEEVLREVG